MGLLYTFVMKKNKYTFCDSKNEFFVGSLKETEKLAAEFCNYIKGGDVILLNGYLGAGKTTFTKGVAKALGVKEIVTSPTFTIMKEYEGKYKLCHFDMYRIEDVDEVEELGLRELLYDDDNICMIEWNKFDELTEYIDVNIERIDERVRKFCFKWVKK